MFDDIAIDVATRQYAQPGENIYDIFRRASEVVRPTFDDQSKADDFVAFVHYAMRGKKFSPGGRILAGAGTTHGNLLNCFVQDESPYEPGTTEGALHLAKKLAVVTRVGGGNGLNLDAYPAKREYTGPVGKAYIYHKSDSNVPLGRYTDLVTGNVVVSGYKELVPVSPSGWLSVYSDEVIVVPDSTEGIWDAAATMVKLLLQGKDVLIDVSQLRPEGSPVSGSGGTSSGPASFAVEIFDNFARWASLGGAYYAGPVATLRYVFAPTLRVIRQGGVRRGAGMATLSASHPDLLDFLTAKTLEREREEGDIGTFNISVLADDEFMGKVLAGNSQERDLMHTIAEQAWATGEPGLLFVDTINKHNMLYPTQGPIRATNPCAEITLYPGEPCDLGAVNLAAYVVDGIPQYRQLEDDACRYAEYLDRILDVEVSPLQEIHDAIQSKRRIGLGMMGLADALIKMGIRYDSEEGLDVAATFAAAIRDGAYRYTTTVAANQGRTAPADVAAAGFDRRNVACLTVAPTGTTAMVMGTTSGIEPLFAPFIYRRIGTEYKQILHPLFKEELGKFPPHPARTQWGFDDDNFQPQGWNWTEVTEDISKNHGSVQGISYIPEEVQDLFVCAHDIDPLAHVAMQSNIQRTFDWKNQEQTYLGNSISKTINLPQKATVQDVLAVYTVAWTSGIKGITVYRDGSRDLQVLNTSLEDDGSSTQSQADDEQLGEILAATCSLDGLCE